MSSLHEQLELISRTPILLVASDYDGTIAPLVADPAAAQADRESVAALQALAEMPQTHVAIISGRALADLAERAPVSRLHLVGSHGSEFEIGLEASLTGETRELRDRLRSYFRELAATQPGVIVEEKPASLAFHYRNVSPDIAQGLVQQALAGPGSWPGVYIKHGKFVLEFSVVPTSKGAGLNRLRQRIGATAVLFVGDDVTDEDAFAGLTGPDVGIKVGPGETVARFRVSDTTEVARVLAQVAEQRAAWLAGSHAVPIEQHSLLSDQRTVALVDPKGRVVWMCAPRIDSSAVFAELLGGPTAGHFEIRPAASGPQGALAPHGQEYVADSFLLRTRWPGLVVTDYLDCSGGRPYQRAGRTDLVRVIEGRGRVLIEFAPRLDYGRLETVTRALPGGLLVEGAHDPLVLVSPGVEWQIERDGRHETARAEVELVGQPLVLEMRYGTASLAPERVPEPARRQRTEQFWSSWAATLTLPRTARDLVRRSALVLKALSYGPTGAICAAATTSLPEHLGGVRNWDYRYCWPRDAAWAALALVRLGNTGSAMRLLDWFLGILEELPPGGLVAPVYTVTGRHLGAEGEIAELHGYRGSRPVRVGNAASHQIQLDVLGPIADLLAALADQGAALSSEHWRLMEAMVAAVVNRWTEPDHGIWEVRRGRRHHVQSKVMCWTTVDRALTVAGYLGKHRPEWEALRDEIAQDILTHGWSEAVKAFCGVYDSAEADAAVLSVGLTGFIAPDDPRFAQTVAMVERELLRGPTVYRYRYDDGLPGVEGGFLLCTSWLIEARALLGRIDEARELFDAYTRLAGPTGLLAEEFDPIHKVSLGNHPQAYSHLGLINAALALEAYSGG